MKDAEIIELYFSRSQSAIAETEKRYGAYLHTIAANLLRCREDVEEIVQDTYFRAWNAIPPTRPTVLRHFLSRITRNLALDRLRKAAGSVRTVELLDELAECIPDSSDSPEEALSAKELGGLLNAFLSRQEESDIRIFVLRFYYAHSLAAIAERAGLTERQVKYRLQCLRRALKQFMKAEGMEL